MMKNDRGRNVFSSATFELSSSIDKNRQAKSKKPVKKGRVALIGSGDVNIELYLFRLLPLLQQHLNEIVYVTSNPWLKSLYSQLPFVLDVVSDVSNAAACSSVVQTKDLVTKYGCDLQAQRNSFSTLSIDQERSQKFAAQWLDDLPRPYIAISWSLREGKQTGNAKFSNSLTELIKVFSHFKGSLVIVQNEVTSEELVFIDEQIGQKLSVPILDCSDLNDNSEEMLAMINLMDEVIGVPDLAQNICSTLNKPSKVLWPHGLVRNPLWDSIRETFFSQHKTYSEDSNGWQMAYDQLMSDCSYLAPSEGNVSPTIKKQDVERQSTEIKSAEKKSAEEQKVQRKKIDGQDVESLIRYASGLVSSKITAESEQRILKMVEVFNSARARTNTDTELNIFVYHTNMGEAGQLQYKDVGLDLNQYDYKSILQIFISAVNRWRPDANIYIVTNSDSLLFDLATNKVKVIGLDVDATTPMFERVNAMCAYAYSKAFSADTLFLDSDAFLNAKFDNILSGDFDVAITTRPNQGLMPVNEGVIIAKHAGKTRAQMFFSRYVATYEQLISDATVQEYYGDVKKWRGGQLTLNAISHQASPYTPYRILNLDGVSVRVLPCDPFNYSWEYGQSLSVNELKEKYIIHVKGGRKDGLKEISELIETFHPENRSLENTASKKPKSTGFVAPHFAVFNKMYNEPPFQNREMVQKFVSHLGTSADMIATNQQGSGAHLSDDMFVWFRNLGFLEEEDFVHAFAPYATDPLLRARIWRVYMLCWAAKSCQRVEGDFVDLGCYDGRTVHVINRYIDFNKIDKRYYLYDLFENPTAESRKAKHGSGLHAEVQKLFSDYPKVEVIKGPVPDSFGIGLPESRLPEKIAFAQIDLNEANAEMAALEVIYDRVTPGGIIIFDDFGFKRYSDSHNRETDYLRERGDIVFESPTGQGLLIKRGC